MSTVELKKVSISATEASSFSDVTHTVSSTLFGLFLTYNKTKYMSNIEWVFNKFYSLSFSWYNEILSNSHYPHNIKSLFKI
jgi:hypothetical protein